MVEWNEYCTFTVHYSPHKTHTMHISFKGKILIQGTVGQYATIEMAELGDPEFDPIKKFIVETYKWKGEEGPERVDRDGWVNFQVALNTATRFVQSEEPTV